MIVIVGHAERPVSRAGDRVAVAVSRLCFWLRPVGEGALGDRASFHASCGPLRKSSASRWRTRARLRRRGRVSDGEGEMYALGYDPTARMAGQHARSMVRRLRMRTLVSLGVLAVATALLGKTFG